MYNIFQLQRYHNFISKCQKRELDITKYFETHHIIPKCMGGDNSKTNLIRLTAREHYLAHWMLWKAYNTPQLAHAFFMMSVITETQQRKIMPAYLYEKLKIEVAKNASIRGKQKHWITNGTTDNFVNKTLPIPSNWYKGRKSFTDNKNIDIYKRTNNDLIYVKTFTSTNDALNYINENSTKPFKERTLKRHCEQAKKNKSSKAGDFYISYTGDKPTIKKPNTTAGTIAAQKTNLGKKRPEHSKLMKLKNINEDTTIYTFKHEKDEHIFTGKRLELIERFPDYNISNSGLGVMIRGGYKTHKGWSLAY